MPLEEKAIDFVIHPSHTTQKPNQSTNKESHTGIGKVLLQEKEGELYIGIYLSKKEDVSPFHTWPIPWSNPNLTLFTLTIEEVSHFNYILQRLYQGGKTSLLELELQGEIDKFLLTYFAQFEKIENKAQLLNDIYSKLFNHFTWRSSLSEKEKNMYEEANALAKKFITRFIIEPKKNESDWTHKLIHIRKFYNLTLPEKIKYIITK